MTDGIAVVAVPPPEDDAVRMVPLTIVIPNGRGFPSALVDALAAQTLDRDEIHVVRNHRAGAARHWAGAGGGAPAPADRPRVRVLDSTPGAAAARNAGWRTAANEWVVFLDDDVEVPGTFLAEVRERLAERPTPRVLGFRVRSTSADPSIGTLSAFVPLDRGKGVYRTTVAVTLDEVWQYGVGAALAAHRRVLEVTGGFKDTLGAGRRNGGCEDLEFLWHAARHAEVEYRGDVAVDHPPAGSVRLVLLKFRQYGRAVAALGGTARTRDGLRLAYHFCRHMARLTDWSRKAGLPRDVVRQVRTGTTLAIVEAARVFVTSSLLRRPSGVGCRRCRGHVTPAPIPQKEAGWDGEAAQLEWRKR